MISTITNYSNNIDTLFPVPGQDNDSQGFRDNFANIRQALNIAAGEISNLSLNTTQLVQKTVIVQGSNGGVQGTNIGLSSATIRLNQNEVDPSRSKPALSITGTSYMSIGSDSTGSVVQITGKDMVASSANWVLVDHPERVNIGSTFKFHDNDTVTYTVTEVEGSKIYVNSTFDLSTITVGNNFRVYGGKMVSSIFRAHTPPTTLLGRAGDEKGAMVITTGSIHIATSDYDGVSNIWSKVSTNVESNRLAVVRASGAYSSSVPNVTCDLSTATRFYINSPNDDIGINFINLPTTPCQVEVCVTIQSTTARLLKVYVNGGASIGQLVNTLTQSSPVWGRRYAITLLAESLASVNAFMDVTNF